MPDRRRGQFYLLSVRLGHTLYDTGGMYRMKRVLSIVLVCILVFCMAMGVFAAFDAKTVTTFNGMAGISNITKTGSIQDSSFDMAKAIKELEIADEHLPGEDSRIEVYYGAAPVTVTFNKAKDWYGISSYYCYYAAVELEPKTAISRYEYLISSVLVEAFTGTISFVKPGTYYLYMINYSSASTDSDVGVFVVVGNAATGQPAVTSVNAVPTVASVQVNGVPVAFEAYTINGNNYFKLRDLAKAVDGTAKNFEVTWDGTKKAINLLSGQRYTAVGGELVAGDGKAKAATVSTAVIYKDGEKVDLSAYTINGNNYFKLRDVAKVFDIGVTWDAATKTIGIDVTQGYIE